MARELEGQVAIVTGGTGGLGQAVTLALLEAGATVAVPYRALGERDRLAHEAASHATRLSLMELDVSQPAAMEGLAAQLMARHGRLDILAHLVGGYAGGKDVHEMDYADWLRMVDLNLNTAFVACHAVLPPMRECDYGRIVAVSSRSAARISPGVAGYTAAKAGLQALVASIAEENRALNVTANAILPSIIDTPANRTAMPKAKHETWPKPEEIAQVVRFLVSPASGLISGAAIPVYGRA